MEHQDKSKKVAHGHGMMGLASVTRTQGPPVTDLTELGARFGRMFSLPPHKETDPKLKQLPDDQVDDKMNQIFAELGKPGGPMQEKPLPQGHTYNSDVPAGYTFLGQFIDHDITLEPISLLEQIGLTPDQIRNFRTPGLDLDNVYGYGLSYEVTPFLYQQQPEHKIKLLIGESSTPSAFPNGRPRRSLVFYDLPRNRENTALIGDPRNDENLIVSQLHVAFLHFHNRLVDQLKGVVGNISERDLFHQTRAHVTYFFHKMVLDDFLPRIIGPNLLADLLNNGPHYFNPLAPNEVYMPVEFSGAAYRFGHSMVRDSYVLNDEVKGSNLFQFGASEMKAPTEYIQWKHFFGIKANHRPVSGRKLDTKLPPSLLDLPFLRGVSPVTSLAARNMMRGRVLGLPSGQVVAQDMIDNGLMPANQKLPTPDDVKDLGMDETPLWFYVLYEAHNLGNDGNHLGPVGGRIVGEVLLGLMKQSPYSPLKGFAPKISLPTTGGKFTMPDLLQAAYPQPPAQQYEYRVQYGDTLSHIAQRFGVTVNAILAINPQITNPNLIYAGQLILIPGGAVTHVWPLS